MKPEEMKGKRGLIVGLARSGLAVANLLEKLGAQVTVTDAKPESELSAIIEKLPTGSTLALGGHGTIDPATFDLAVASPGVPWDVPILEALRQAGVRTVSEVEFASWFIDAPIAGITGSNGKSTTTALTGAIFDAAGRKTFVGGNIGRPLTEAAGGDYDWVVAELSSFQLEGIETFRPRIGACLNLAPDHLDRHGDMERYGAIKARLALNMGPGDTYILNAADTGVSDFPSADGVDRRHFGKTGEGNTWIEGGKAVTMANGKIVPLFNAGDLKIAGRHNLENSLAAAAIALAAGIDPAVIRKSATTFAGLPHRMERVGVIDGVIYINDSKGTNVDATCKSLSGYDKNVALIAGGSSKGADFAPLAKMIRKTCKGVALIGQTAPQIAEALGDFQPVAFADTLEEALSHGAGWLQAGETLLLSPACASFDLFKSFEDRGDKFRAAVAKRKETEGRHAG